MQVISAQSVPLPEFHLFAEVDDEGLSQLLQLLLDLPVAGAGLVLVQAAVSLHLVLQPVQRNVKTAVLLKAACGKQTFLIKLQCIQYF